MKRIKRVLGLLIFAFLLIPGIGYAASANLSVTSASTGVVGNNLNVTVTLSSGTAIGSWEFDISYDRSLLQLTSSTAESGGTHAANSASSASGIKSKSYNYTFKVLKSGSATIRVTSSDVIDMVNESRMTVNNGSRTVSLKTQAEIEASYSSDATLKALSVGEYTISPEFNKDTYEYEVEVPNEISSVNITATKNDANASVTGAGEKELVEGNNKVEIVVTAQKGNSLTYVLNINRKELNPIKVNVDNKDYSFVRKKDLLPELTGFVEDTITYEDTEIPALYNSVLDLKVVGLKDEEGNVSVYTFANGKVDKKYISLTNSELTIMVINIEEKWHGFVNREIDINNTKVKVVSLSKDSKQVIVLGKNVLNNDAGYYLYDSTTNTFTPIDLTDIYKLNKNNTIYKLIILLLSIVVVLLLALKVFKKDAKKSNKQIIDDFEYIKEKKEKENEKEDIKEEIEEAKEELIKEKEFEEEIIEEELKIEIIYLI